MRLHEFLILASAHFIALLSPGPDFFILIGNTARHGVRSGLGTALGISLANAAYILCALAGFGFLSEWTLLHQIIRWLGAAYLISIAWAFLKSGLSPRTSTQSEQSPDKRETLWQGFATGFMSGALNPKNGLFYLGLFSASVSAATPASVRIFYGVWMFLVVLLWDGLLVLCLRSRPAMNTLWRRLPSIEVGAGVCLVAIAVLIIATGA